MAIWADSDCHVVPSVNRTCRATHVARRRTSYAAQLLSPMLHLQPVPRYETNRDSIRTYRTPFEQFAARAASSARPDQPVAGSAALVKPGLQSKCAPACHANFHGGMFTHCVHEQGCARDRQSNSARAAYSTAYMARSNPVGAHMFDSAWHAGATMGHRLQHPTARQRNRCLISVRTHALRVQQLHFCEPCACKSLLCMHRSAVALLVGNCVMEAAAAAHLYL